MHFERPPPARTTQGASRGAGRNHQLVRMVCCAGRSTAGPTQLKRISVQKRYQKRLDDSLTRCSCLVTEGGRNSIMHIRGWLNRSPSVELCGQGTSIYVVQAPRGSLVQPGTAGSLFWGAMASSSPSALSIFKTPILSGQIANSLPNSHVGKTGP